MSDVRTACLACDSRDIAATFEAREMMFGTREAFSYQECAACDSLQIAAVPDGLDAHYPAGYYAYQATRGARAKLGWKATMLRAPEDLGRGSAVGRALNRWLGLAHYGGASPDQAQRWIAGLPRGLGSRVLDVGCGSGRLLRQMRRAGFRDVVGIDPYLPDDAVADGVPLLRRTTDEVDRLGTFDLVMMHHVLEHVADPLAVLSTLASALTPAGRLLVRVPVAATFSARHYGPDWVQLDPPRHLFVPSERGLRALVARAGLAVEAVEYDSTEFQFWASEQYQAGIPLMDPRSRASPGGALPHSAAAMASLRDRARALNAVGDGDQAAFFLSACTPTQ